MIITFSYATYFMMYHVYYHSQHEDHCHYHGVNIIVRNALFLLFCTDFDYQWASQKNHYTFVLWISRLTMSLDKIFAHFSLALFMQITKMILTQCLDYVHLNLKCFAPLYQAKLKIPVVSVHWKVATRKNIVHQKI